MAPLSFTNILVVGMGLIGGSILKSLKDTGNSASMFGVDVEKRVVKEAYGLRLINNKNNKVDKIKEDCLVVFCLSLNELYFLPT